jgi:hypothetical protein
MHHKQFNETTYTLFQYHLKITLSLPMNYTIYRWYHNMLIAT